MISESELRERLRQEPWGRYLVAIGREPYDTESAARRVAEHAADDIGKLLVLLREALENPEELRPVFSPLKTRITLALDAYKILLP